MKVSLFQTLLRKNGTGFESQIQISRKVRKTGKTHFWQSSFFGIKPICLRKKRLVKRLRYNPEVVFSFSNKCAGLNPYYTAAGNIEMFV